MLFQNINYDIDTLPTMPTVAAQVIELINSPHSSVEQLAAVVAKDPNVAARVLKIANSSFYSMSRKISTLPSAIVVLGERTLKNLVLAASMRGLNSTFGDYEKMLWEDSMVCALGSRFLAGKTGCADPEEAFMAGLFRHIGKAVVYNRQRGGQPEVEAMLRTESVDMSLRERELLGATHDEIGAAVLERWRLSEMISEVALHHLDVDLGAISDPETRNMVCVVNLANQFPAIFGVLGEPHMQELSQLAGAKYLGLSQADLDPLVDEFHKIFTANRNEFLA